MIYIHAKNGKLEINAKTITTKPNIKEFDDN